MHIKFNGAQCRQPAMRHKKYCHFHNFMYERNQMPEGERFRIPFVEDTPSIQLGINQVLRALICNQIDTKKAGILLYGLQLSSNNLTYYDREAFPPPPPEKKEEPPSLARILLEKLGADFPDTFTEEEHEQLLQKPHPNPALAKPPSGTSTKPLEPEVDSPYTSPEVTMDAG